MSQHARVPFTKEHDMYLMKYLAKYCPSKQGRLGNSVYKDLVANADGYWPWAKHHPWQSWRERYKKNTEYFDARISRYQQEHGVHSTDSDDEHPEIKRVKKPKVVNASPSSVVSRKRTAEDSSFETPRPSTKRPKVANGSTKVAGPSGRYSMPPIEYYESVPHSADRRSKPKRSDSQAGPSRTSHPHEADQLSVQSSPQREEAPSPMARTTTNGSVNNQSPSRTPLQDKRQSVARAKVGSPPVSTAQALKSGKKLPQKETPSSLARRPLQKRHREQSTPFASIPATPKTVAGNSISPLDRTPMRAPPRIVNTFGGSCLVDQRGRTPRPYPESGEENGSEQNGEDNTWPPIRPSKGKERADMNRLSHMMAQHHPFSQVQKPNQPEANVNVVQRHHVGNSFTDGNNPDKRQEVDSNQSKHDRSELLPHDDPHPVPKLSPRPSLPSAAPDSGPKLDAEANATPPRAPTPCPTTRMQPSPLARVSLPALDGSRLEQVPSVDLAAFSSSTSHKPSRPINGIHARQSLPVHLTSLPAGRDAFARQSTWPNSRYGSPFFARPHRQSHPGYAPSPANVNTAPARPFPTSAFTFVPPLNLPLAPAQVPPANATPPLQNHGRARLADTLLTPHPPDVSLAATQGLTSILSAMSANHGLALDVVVAVYKRAGSLKETDKVLEGMREAAEEWAERALRRMGERRDSHERMDTDEYRELEPRHRQVDDDDAEDVGTRQSASRGGSHRELPPRGRRSAADLDYVLAPPSVETSEYSPPETTRAAKWKRRSMGGTSRSLVDMHQNENSIQRSKDDNDERERGQVEQMLVIDGRNEERTSTIVPPRSHVEGRRVSQIAVPVSPDDHPPEGTHNGQEEHQDIRVLLRTLEPQELEKKLGRDVLRQRIGNLFKAK
ncbi:hypothetical protein EV401DRAFT_2077247 [Pisolithus croceorrhizus]|nr:hypothetical protein EV401DRAFT_2077247 [Pisolithus croceorrhizus]